jgi:hypothetical protein
MSKRKTIVSLFPTEKEEIDIGEKRIVYSCPADVEIRRDKIAFCLEFEGDKVCFIVYEQKKNTDYGKTIFEAEFNSDDPNAKVRVTRNSMKNIE